MHFGTMRTDLGWYALTVFPFGRPAPRAQALSYSSNEGFRPESAADVSIVVQAAECLRAAALLIVPRDPLRKSLKHRLGLGAKPCRGGSEPPAKAIFQVPR
jgi:hypothetical protein